MLGFAGRQRDGTALLLAIASAVWGAVGCAASQVRDDFVERFKCAEREVTVSEGADGLYRASGCEERAVYDCTAGSCSLKRRVVMAQEETTPMAVRGRHEARVTNEATDATVSLDLKLEDRTTLKLRAAPSKHGELAQLKVQRYEAVSSLTDCQVDLMINGQKLALPEPTETRDPGRSSLVVNLTRELVRDMAIAEQLALRVCSKRFSLSREQILQVRDFVVRYEEELGWVGDEREATGGIAAPTGGWPKWQPLAPLPAEEANAKVLEPSELFKKVSPWVVRVEGVLRDDISQGSGVSVSPTQVLTNCHVVEGAIKITIKQQKREWVARLESSQPKADRCVLAIDEAVLAPVRGVRPYRSLVVGEAVYTVGAPSGLDLSLSDGLLSGLREEGALQLIQTTAPISPGSSGGPLFDAKGNLLGITTLALIGRKRLNQALNFAIPADSYWAP